jgi:mRNA-degrading endonuclease RelE of RelBE toxin-antitoxin system
VRERQVEWLPGTREALRALPPVPRRKVREALRDLQRGNADGKPLEQELAGLWRIAVGDLRLVYRQTAATIVLVAIGPRRTIYRDLEIALRAASARRK